MRLMRTPAHPRKSILSGRGPVPDKGIELIDLGADPIKNYGIVYINTEEAKQVAKLIGYVDGAVTAEKFAAMDEELRSLRAQVNAAPKATEELLERLHNELNDTVSNLIADYRNTLGAELVAGSEGVPSWAAGAREDVYLADSGRHENLQRISGGALEESAEHVGGSAVSVGGDDDDDEGLARASVGRSNVGGGSGPDASGADDAAGNTDAGSDRQGSAPGTSVLDVFVADDDEASGH